MKIHEIYDLIDKVAPFDSAMSGDNVGLLVGSGKKEVSKILLCLDITEPVIKEASAKGVNLIIAHHPVIFDPLKKVDGNSVLYSLIKNDIAAICCHTNLDLCAKMGVNRALADRLGIDEIFIPEGKTYFQFELKEETDVETYANHIKNCFPNCSLQYSSFSKKIKTLAMCAGSGSHEITPISSEIDAFVTGEIKYDKWLEATHKNLAVFAFGHFETESVYIPYMEKYLKENTNDIEISASADEIGPIRYL